jgi:hypothetical protein
MSKQKVNFWPHFIVLSIFGVAGLCVWTVKIAVNNPVEMDSFYFDSYYNVDQDINNIILKQQAFDKKYHVTLPNKNFTIGTNSLTIKVDEIASGKGVDDANITVVITRPNTQRLDKKPKQLSSQDGVYSFEPFEIKNLGRWQIMSKVTIGELTTFKKLEVNATK